MVKCFMILYLGMRWSNVLKSIKQHLMNIAIFTGLACWLYFFYREYIICPQYILEHPNSKAPSLSCSVTGWMQMFYLLIAPVIIGFFGIKDSKLYKIFSWAIIILLPFLMLSFLRLKYFILSLF